MKTRKIKKEFVDMRQQYKILSRNSSHKGDVGDFVSGFRYKDEIHYTLKLKDEGFRSYPIRNLELQEPEVQELNVVDKKMMKKFLNDAMKLMELLERHDRHLELIKMLDELK